MGRPQRRSFRCIRLLQLPANVVFKQAHRGASRTSDYNPSAGLERIQATVLAINSADDERNPPENGVLDREITRVKHGRVLLIPASDKTAGHGTTGQAKFWKNDLATVLQSAPRLGK